MYKDILQTLNNDRRVDDSFMERLDKNGFRICYGKFEYWNNQPYIKIGKKTIWLVEICYSDYGGCMCSYKYRNEVVEDIKTTIEQEKKILEEETKMIDEILPIK